MTSPLFLAAPEQLLAAAPGATVELGGPEGRHAVSVQRLRAGEDIDLADGTGRRVRGVVAGSRGKDVLQVRVLDVVDEPAPSVELILVQALAKGGRDEQAVESAVEVGVDAIVPWRAARCVSVWEGPKVAKGRERWGATARAAAKQSRRAHVPPVEALATTRDLEGYVRRTVEAGGAVLVAHEEATAPLLGARLPWGRPGEPAPRGVRVAVVVGPEGGISPQEVAALEAAGAQPVRLGPHVLRTSTAGPIALSLLAHASGRWGT